MLGGMSESHFREKSTDANLAVQTSLVDDTELLGTLPGASNVDIDFRGDSAIDLYLTHQFLSQRIKQIQTLVMITSSSLGSPSFLIAFPRISSERPFEYT